jgi:uncharacterized protein (TIGR00255 family)
MPTSRACVPGRLTETMAIRSMTGFAQVTGQVNGNLRFTLSLKTVNHRFLDIHFRMPPGSDALEMKIRRVLKEKLARGHLELSLTVDRTGANGVVLNRQVVNNYVQSFRAAAAEFKIAGEPDLNAALKLPGAMDAEAVADDGELENVVLAKLEDALLRLDDMRAEEGRGMERELRERMEHLRAATAEIEKLRSTVVHAYVEKLHARLKELIGSHADSDRILQEAAVLAERSDVQEEIVRLQTHVQHFLQMLSGGGEVGKKLDFLLQEMNREANTLLSKTSGVAAEALRITETGLAMKAEIEKSREQVQNLE